MEEARLQVEQLTLQLIIFLLQQYEHQSGQEGAGANRLGGSFNGRSQTSS
jgi:hypothetical protein